MNLRTLILVFYLSFVDSWSYGAGQCGLYSLDFFVLLLVFVFLEISPICCFQSKSRCLPKWSILGARFRSPFLLEGFWFSEWWSVESHTCFSFLAPQRGSRLISLPSEPLRGMDFWHRNEVFTQLRPDRWAFVLASKAMTPYLRAQMAMEFKEPPTSRAFCTRGGAGVWMSSCAWLSDTSIRHCCVQGGSGITSCMSWDCSALPAPFPPV